LPLPPLFSQASHSKPIGKTIKTNIIITRTKVLPCTATRKNVASVRSPRVWLHLFPLFGADSLTITSGRVDFCSI
jgi:hypothetical protein